MAKGEIVHSSTATQRAKDKVSKETARASWEAHRASGKPMSEWNDPSAEPMHDRYTRAKTEGRLRSGAPMRSIKESLVNRGPGQRAASAYSAGGYLRRKAAAEFVPTITKAAKKAASEFKFTRKGIAIAAGTIGAAGVGYLAGRAKGKE